MGYHSGQLSIAKSVPTVEPVGLKRFNISLLIETTLVTIVAILAIRFFTASLISRAAWLVSPGILIAAALIPIAIRRYEFPKIGFNIRQIIPTVLIVCRTCVVVFSALFTGLWLLKSFGFGIPFQPVPPTEQGWFSWLFYQFMYVAVAEEMFFRGYVQGNILKMINPDKDDRRPSGAWLSIVLSAACFAVAHIIVQGRIALLLTFLPGLILGWLFIRTKSLLAPILFHGIANTYYCVMALVLM